MNKLLQGISLGDRRPSHLLREMRNLAGGNINDDFLRPLFLQRLPHHVRFVLAGSEESPEKLAEMADRILDCSQPSQTEIHGVSSNKPEPSNLHFSLIMEQVTRLATAVTELTSRLERMSSVSSSYNNTHNSRSPMRGSSERSRSRSRGEPPSGVPLCYFHYTYGTNARKCKRTAENGAPCAMAHLQEN